MSNDIFPATIRGLTYAVTRSSEFGTIVQTAPNRAETRIQQYRNPVWRWELTYEFLKDDPADIVYGATYTDLRTLIGFGLARAGQADDFLFQDPDDHSATDQPLALLNYAGAIYYSPLQRNIGGFLEDVTDLNGPIAVKANGILTTDYTIEGPGYAYAGASYAGLVLQWAHTPTAPITASFDYLFRVRFADDALPLDKWAHHWWTAGGPDSAGSSAIKLVSARNGGGRYAGGGGGG